jgi:hypothetical protein
MAPRARPVPTPNLDAIVNPPPARRDPDPTRTRPNGFCIECGIKLARRDALRCRTHANRLLNKDKKGNFTPDLARRAVRLRDEQRRKDREELARLREIFKDKLEEVRRENETRRAAEREKRAARAAARQQATVAAAGD